MFRKRFYIKMDIVLHTITCPGVWLCTHGYLEVTLKMLSYYFRTGCMEPRFPLLCHDKFKVEGHFNTIQTLDELKRVMGAERMEITLWQSGRRLAYYSGKLTDVLQSPPTSKLNCEHTVNVQLLMKPTTAFPGIIAPKIEISAEVTVQDKSRHGTNFSSDRCSADKRRSAYTKFEFRQQRPLQNRHCQQSEHGGSCLNYLEEKRRQRPVCHLRTQATRSAEFSYGSSSAINGSSEATSVLSEERDASVFSSYRSTRSPGDNIRLLDTLCGHSQLSLGESTPREDHKQSYCDICQTYRRTFMQCSQTNKK